MAIQIKTRHGQPVAALGFAIEDFSALRWLRDKIAITDKWQHLDMIADPDDPRDLFGMIQREQNRSA